MLVVCTLASSCEENWIEVYPEDVLGHWAFDAGSINTEDPNQDYTYPDFRPGNRVNTSVKVSSNKGGIDIQAEDARSDAYLEFFEDGHFEGFNTAYAIRGRYEVGPEYQIWISLEERDYELGMESDWAFLFDVLLEKMQSVQVHNERLVLKDGFLNKELIFRRVQD